MHSTEADAKDGSATYAQIVFDKCASHAAQSLSDSWVLPCDEGSFPFDVSSRYGC
jgi:hypothetical protein